MRELAGAHRSRGADIRVEERDTVPVLQMLNRRSRVTEFEHIKTERVDHVRRIESKQRIVFSDDGNGSEAAVHTVSVGGPLLAQCGSPPA